MSTTHTPAPAAAVAVPKPMPKPAPAAPAKPKPGLTRTKYWATREYHKFLLAQAKTPFAWGTNDCCMFPANAIQAFTGTDIAADFRDKYKDETSAMALIKTVTGTGTTVADAAAYCAAKHGMVEHKFPKMAQRGDLVVIANGGTLIAGIVHLNGRHIISVGGKGLVRLPISKVLRSWAV